MATARSSIREKVTSSSNNDAAAAAILPGHYGQAVASAPSQEEYNKIYEDVYGRMPPGVELMERRMVELEREIGLLPEEQKASVLRAHCHQPALFCNSAHTNLFLQSEDFDPREGAVRMARYWEQREAMFGERAFASDCFKRPTRQDYLRYYKRSLTLSEDLSADETMRMIAKEYIKNVHRSKIESMKRILDGEGAVFIDVAAPDELKLLFLQAEDFREDRAAQRMIRYYETEAEIFGPDVRLRRGGTIKLDDLEKYGSEMSSGVWRLMPNSDEHGRSVIVLSMQRLSTGGLTQEGLDAAAWYTLNSALEKPACKKNGIVSFISYKGFTRDLLEKLPSFRERIRKIMYESIPISVKASHVFFDPDCTWWQKIAVPGFSTMGSSVIVKAVVHVGTDEERMASLRDHGISEECVPVELGGKVAFEAWEEFLADRKSKGL